ncbi:MAG TPA: phosphoribosylformimino-5-aminoimidazole carboxamide ribotide isomerase [Planctomycetota bacterium]|nr:phosphoribosylformimino-5-aminoimidazole carboxamide ribotide isomerase [Planctomycetota bacterium]
MTLFRPCIDLHEGQVKQIVGGTLSDHGVGRTNFVSPHGPEWFARRYSEDGLEGGHVIMLGPGNDEAARAAIGAWPKGLQVGGGMDADKARTWLKVGATKIIATSWLFPNTRFSEDRLRELSSAIGRDQLVIDLSCRRRGDQWIVATNKWQTLTDTALGAEFIRRCADYASELLIHAADVEGLCQGIDEELVSALATWSPIPCTYAGGAKELGDLERVERLSKGAIDLTIGSALDLFGGTVKYHDCVAWNRARRPHGAG